MSRKQTVLRTKTLPSTLNLNNCINKIKKIENNINKDSNLINNNLNKSEESDISKQENIDEKKNFRHRKKQNIINIKKTKKEQKINIELMINNTDTTKLITYENFDYKAYLYNYADLGYTDLEGCWSHYQNYGKNENRIIFPINKICCYEKVEINDLINFRNIYFDHSDCEYYITKSHYGKLNLNNLNIIEEKYDKNSSIDFTDIKFINLQKDIELPKYNDFDMLKSFIVIIDFPKYGGGTNVFLNTILTHYKYYNTFFIIRNYDEKYIVTINDDYYFESFMEKELNYFLKQYNYKIMKIFINHVYGHNYTFLYNLKILEKEISYITHDYTGIYRESQYKFTDFCELHEIKQNILEVCNSIITQNKKNLNLYSNFIKPETNIYISELPDFSKSGNKIQINSEKIVIGIFGAVLDIKGLKILNLLVNYFKNHDNIDFIIFGETNLKVNTLKYVRYHTINRFNELLSHYKPNIILELGLCPETYSYTLTLAMLTQLPILCLKKNMDCTVEARLSTYNKVYFFDTIKDFTEQIYKIKQDYLYTIDTKMYYNDFWNNYFIDTQKNTIYTKIKYSIEPYCIYFPQFHNIPENNINFYDNYTDIHNLNILVKDYDFDKIETPNLNYYNINEITQYNLKNQKIIKKQIELIKDYSFAGLAVYYYWFSLNEITKRNVIMDDVIDMFFEKNINFYDKKIFFIWANENWSGNTAFNSNYKIENTYEVFNLEKNILNLIKYFKHERYLKVNNKPILFIHHPWTINKEEFMNIIKIFNRVCKENKFDGIDIYINDINETYDEYNINELKSYYCNFNYKKTNSMFTKNKLAYLDFEKYINEKPIREYEVNTLVYDFNNSARLIKPYNIDKSTRCINNTEINKIYFTNNIIKKYRDNKNKILLINSLNEWGEKMAIEPSLQYGFYYLNFISKYLSI